ncbi:MAG: polyprenyl synthetase family protein [Prevotellaceae bacterium]|jgi:geranylgeranyl diphosphate synthase type II|nr:polyprenyl synthetase family protein [Prevotellaceae bacterium]
MLSTGHLQSIINQYIAELPIVQPPTELYKPIVYTLQGGGKRVRPVLMLAAYSLYNGGNFDAILAPATGIELFHNYTLLHDDVMDGAALRHGRKTVYRAWNENTAILSGDAMYVLASQYIARVPDRHLREVLSLYNQMAIEVCQGQQYDMNFEHRTDVTTEQYLEMIRLKTAVLMATSLKIGAILADAPTADADRLYQFGIYVGLAFQIRDDYLDVYGSEDFGKSTGSDIVSNKKTYLLIQALEKADREQRAALLYQLHTHTTDEQSKVETVTRLYDQIGVKEICENQIRIYFAQATEILSELTVNAQQARELRDFARELMFREI